MKKTYIIPETLIVKVQPQRMISESLPSGSTPTDPQYFETKYNWGSFWDEWAGAAGE